MMNGIRNTASSFDIEQNRNHEPSPAAKTAMVTACTAIGVGLTSLGGMFLAGAIGRTGPFAVPHNYGIVCSYSKITGQALGCSTEDQSSSKAITYGVIGTGLVGLGAVTTWGAYKIAKSTRTNA